jgi:single-stranded-DNA-specific exonuclease
VEAALLPEVEDLSLRLAAAAGVATCKARLAPLDEIDAEVPFSALTSAAVADLERLAPFGNSNPRPLLCTSDVTLCEPPKAVGGGQRHLSLPLVQHGVQFKAIAFGGSEWAGELSETDGPISVAFRPFVNHFRGRKSVELQVCDWQPSAAARIGQAEQTSAAP